MRRTPPLPSLLGSLWLSHRTIFSPSDLFIIALAGWLSQESEWYQVTSVFFSVVWSLLNAVIWIVLIFPQISSCFKAIFKHVGPVPSASTTTGTSVTLMFHSFFNSQASCNYFIFSVVRLNGKILKTTDSLHYLFPYSALGLVSKSLSLCMFIFPVLVG